MRIDLQALGIDFLAGILGRIGDISAKQYRYHPERDCYHCPASEILSYRTTNRLAYRECASNPARGTNCTQRAQCRQSQNHQKLVTRCLWDDFEEAIDADRLRIWETALRPEEGTVERSYADAKELHGHRYALFRELVKAQAQCLLSATCQNMKKMALLLVRKAAALFTQFMGLWARQIQGAADSPAGSANISEISLF